MPKRNREKGQVSILIAIIFQVVFVFFAMVVNVGLLVHDKINLQNSVDIAAYYGAMKQAEVLNAIGHVNYQIRQIWKLMNWRLWVLGDAGRDATFNTNLGTAPTVGEGAATWPVESGGYSYNNPIICIVNPFWFDDYALNPKAPDNQCGRAYLNIPNLKPIQLVGFQTVFPFLQIFQQQSQQNANKFADNISATGPTNFRMALKIMLSYKMAINNRKKAIHYLQNLLVSSGTNARDFSDLAGNPVGKIVVDTLKGNLTSTNNNNISEIQFHNSLSGQPFLVPVETRVFLKYLDIYNTGDFIQANIKDMNVSPSSTSDSGVAALAPIAQAVSAYDYMRFTPSDRLQFYNETDQDLTTDYKSIVGFEKDPWVLAYVHLKASTTPRMLFTPIGTKTITLSAEAYAMPFGGRVGPWYYTKWNPGDPRSSGNAPQDLVDALLPPRVDGQQGTVTTDPPNYSRFPGDKLGLRSELARTTGLKMLWQSPGQRAHFVNDDYANLVADPASAQQDPVVYHDSNPQSAPVRLAEIGAVAPDLFDVIYYSIDAHFPTTVQQVGNNTLFNTCPTCHDLGSLRTSGNQYQDIDVAQQITAYTKNIPSQAYWIARDPKYLSTGWNQAQTDIYNQPTDGLLVPKENGGRAGYSVKIVSRKYLESSLSLGGPGVSPGGILNPPSQVVTPPD